MWIWRKCLGMEISGYSVSGLDVIGKGHGHEAIYYFVKETETGHWSSLFKYLAVKLVQRDDVQWSDTSRSGIIARGPPGCASLDHFNLTCILLSVVVPNSWRCPEGGRWWRPGTKLAQGQSPEAHQMSPGPSPIPHSQQRLSADDCLRMPGSNAGYSLLCRKSAILGWGLNDWPCQRFLKNPARLFTWLDLRARSSAREANCVSQECLSLKSTLQVIHQAIGIKMFCQIWGNNMFHHLTQDTSKGDWSIIGSRGLVTFFEQWWYVH